MGMHCPHVRAIAPPNAILTLIMMNQTANLVHPDEIRRMVRPNEVLLQSAARMEKDPARLVYKRYCSRFWKLNSESDRPKPKVIEAETKAQDATRDSWKK